MLCCVIVVATPISMGCSREEPKGGALAVLVAGPATGEATQNVVTEASLPEAGGADRDGAVDADSRTAGGASSALEQTVDGWRRAARERGLRQSYLDCLDASSGATWELLDCIAHESEHQDSRLESVYRRLQDMLTQTEVSRLVKEQEQWAGRRAKGCAWDPETEGEGQMIDAKSCELDWTAARARELEARVHPQ